MQATLIVVGGKASKGRVSLDLPIVIGRSRSADMTVAHPLISRRHCEIYDCSGLLMVRDLDSLNGTLVAGQKVREAALRPDDEFTVGPLTFRVRYEYSVENGSPEEGFSAVEIADEPQVEISAGGCELDQTSPQPKNIATNIPPELEETLDEGEDSGIAPRDGQLPDFSQWADPLEGGVDAKGEETVPIDPSPEDDGHTNE